MFVPYKPDYSAGIPVQDFNVIQQERLSKQRTPVRDNQLGIIVPLIRIHPRQSDWAQLASLAQKYPRVNTVGVVSPSQDSRGLEGSDDFGVDPEFDNAVKFLQNSSVIVLGYVNIDPRLVKDMNAVRREIDRWKELYPNINGIYFDNMLNAPNAVSYAKVDKGFRYVFANLASGTTGGVVNQANDFVEQMKGVDTFVIYEREGYPVESWYASMKKDWMAKYNRSKFAFVAYRVGPETLECRNFIDRCVSIEKLAGYVYVQGGSNFLEDRRKMSEMTNLSPLTETCLIQLDAAARGESIPFVRGVTPQTEVVDAEKRDVNLPPRIGTDSPDSPNTITTATNTELDKFGIRKLYPSVMGEGFNEWFLFEENPRADVNFKNLPDNITREADGSWVPIEKKKKPVRLEAWSARGKPFLNMEITGYFKALEMPEFGSATTSLIEQYARTGHKEAGKGAAYIGKLFTNGTVAVQKAINRKAVTGHRGTTQATVDDLSNRWIGVKFIVYNYTELINGAPEGTYNTFVGMEIWIDDNVTDQSGRLVVKNDWRHVMTMEDKGGWFATTITTTEEKKKKGKGKKKPKPQDDNILIEPNADDNRNCVAWIWENVKVAFKHLSVREINRIAPD